METPKMKIERVWAMGNHRTFQIPPIRKLIQEEKQPGVLIEPFPYQSKLDVFEYLKQFPDDSGDFALIDPPYSKRQVSDHYKELGVKVTGWHTSSGWTAKVKFEVARVMKVGSKAITFGWNSCGLGVRNGFEIERILLVCHGGDHYDTICTVERKVKNRVAPILKGSE
jgi:hypothetical protein